MHCVNVLNLNPDTDIGASAWLVELDDRRILLDAGMHPKIEGREALPKFGKAGTHVSVADIADARSLEKVRSYKKQMKAAKKSNGKAAT